MSSSTHASAAEHLSYSNLARSSPSSSTVGGHSFTGSPASSFSPNHAAAHDGQQAYVAGRLPAIAGPVRSSYRTTALAPAGPYGVASSSSSPSAHTPRSSNSGSGTHSHSHTLSSASSFGFGPQQQHPFVTPAKMSGSYDHSMHSNGRKRKTSPEPSASPSQPGGHHRGNSSAASDGELSSPNMEGLAGLAAAAAGDVNGSSSASKAAALAATKRIKTARACDSCRRKKIRCDVIDDGGPSLGDPNNGNGGLTCAHCRQYGFECTFFLPITETRFKKKREREAEEMAAAAAAAAAASRTHMGAGILPPLMHPSRTMPMGAMQFGASPAAPGGPPMSLPMRSPSSGMSGYNKAAHLEVPPVRISSTQEWPRHDHARERPSPTSSLLKRDGSSSSLLGQERRKPPDPALQTDDTPPPPDTRVLGPTSIAYIVHSTAFVPGAAIEEHDLKHHQTFEVGASGDGIIKFHKPPRSATAAAEEGDDTVEDLVRVPDSIRGRLAGDVAEKLVNTYFEKLGYLFPVITKSEFLHMSPPPPLMLYAICGVAALSREVPKEVLSAIKITLNGAFRDIDVLSNSNMNNVKAMLIMSLHSDLHGSTAVQAGSRCWNRVGAAVRMAQDLGLHRDASGRDDLDDDAYFLEQKRRVWGCCVTADRCMSISLGHPLAIDLTDCDVRLPSPHEILRYPTDLPAAPGVERPFAFNTEMLKLSILFGRVMKTIYSPTGLMKTTDDEIVGLLNDMDLWKENLPAALQFRGAKESPPPAGILHISYACLLHLFFRVFMRISYNCPQHLTFSLTIERMTTLIKITRESVAWVDLNEYYLDTLQFVSYGLVFCATVQYHAWIRRGDQEALATLKKASDCVNRFKRQGEQDSSEDLSMRAKTGEVISLLHECAIGSYSNTPNSGNLNPTAGVTNRRWVDTVRGIVFKPDQTRPGGGVYVATNNNLMLDDLPQGTMILQETEAGAVPALVRTNQESNGGWRTVGDMNGGAKGNAASQLAGGVGGQVTSLSSEANPELTHVAGNVWADAEGRPVDRQGSRLLTMIPVPGGDAMIQSYPGGPRLSFSAIANGIVPPTSSAADMDGASEGVNAQAHSLNDASWLNAMTSQNSNGGTSSLPPTFNFSDLYTFDGQIAQPAALLRNAYGVGNSTANVASSANVNPSLYALSGDQSVMSGNFSHTTNGAASAGVGGQAINPLALDGMPGGPLDFAAWEQWFRGATSVNMGGA